MEKYKSHNKNFTKLFLGQQNINFQSLDDYFIETIYENEQEESKRQSILDKDENNEQKSINLDIFNEIENNDEQIVPVKNKKIDQKKKDNQQSWRNVVQLQSPSLTIKEKSIPQTSTHNPKINKKLNLVDDKEEIKTQQNNKKGVTNQLKRILYGRPLSLRKSEFKYTETKPFKLSSSNKYVHQVRKIDLSKTKNNLQTKSHSVNKREFKNQMIINQNKINIDLNTFVSYTQIRQKQRRDFNEKLLEKSKQREIIKEQMNLFNQQKIEKEIIGERKNRIFRANQIRKYSKSCFTIK